ncbi:hypothetical protein CCAND93_760003 [Capnocytophaga canis]|uniref:Uncharacterized protein n=1 Tax=Capnocytophaga canis TaxID=1848903 RepID=A0A0B7IQQ1_9FLAO|nr:hypothetical protein CCAND93_760003 [Capnocytophaga canis]
MNRKPTGFLNPIYGNDMFPFRPRKGRKTVQINESEVDNFPAFHLKKSHKIFLFSKIIRNFAKVII